MPVRFLLVLVGALAGEAVAATQGPSFLAFRSEPLVFWKPAPRTRLWLSATPAGPGSANTPTIQLKNERTGVTCAMRILEVKPVPDAQIVAPLSGPHPDRIVRSSLSPCVE